MSRLNAFVPRLSRRAQLGLGAAALVIAGAAGGAGAVSLTRPSIEMAPTVPTAIAKLSDARGVVTVKGRVAEVYGDHFVLQDATGRTMIDAGRAARNAVRLGTAMTVQGRYDDGQMRASYLVDPQGEVAAVGPAGGPRGPHDRDGPGRPGDPRRDGLPPPPPGGPGDPAALPVGAGAPPPPPGCAALPVGRVDMPPPPTGERAAPPPQPMNGPVQPAVR